MPAPAAPFSSNETRSVGTPRAQANAEEWAFGRRNNGLFAALFLVALAVLTFVVLRGT